MGSATTEFLACFFVLQSTPFPSDQKRISTGEHFSAMSVPSQTPRHLKQLGFTQAWRYEEEGKAWVAQVDRQGCELILSSQWPDKVGKGLMFISLDVGVLDALRAELEGRGVDVKDGQWGYRLMVIADPDGNELYFPYPTSLATGSLITSNPGH